MNEQIEDILRRRCAKYLFNGKIFYTRDSVLDAMNEALRIHDVVGKSEQLSCSTCKWLKRTDDYCDTCFKFEKHEKAT